MQKQVNVGDKVQAEFNGVEVEGLVTWVSSFNEVCVFQQEETGHLYWIGTDDLVRVDENKEVTMNENDFEIGDKVVALTPHSFKVGEIVSADYYEDEEDSYYEVYFKELDQSYDYTSSDLYDLEGLSLKGALYDGELVKVIDDLDDGNVLVVDYEDNVMFLSKEEVEEDNREYCSGCADCAYPECADTQSDSIISELRDLLQQRSETGIRKYGTTLDRTDLDSSEWCQHLLEELLDAAGYVLRLKKDLEALQGGYSYVKNNNSIELK